MSLAHPLRRSLVPLLLLASATVARAGGIDLSWSDCGSFGTGQRSFACTTNAFGSEVLIASAVPAVAMPALNGNDCVILIQTPSATLPAWWQFQSGGCRAGNVSVTSDFTSFGSCVDPWQGFAAAGFLVDYPVAGSGPDVERIRTVTGLPSGAEMAVDTSHELYLVRVTILHGKTVGTGSCAGCTQSACIVLQKVELLAPGGGVAQTLTNTLLRQHVVWQDPALVAGCPGATPARDRTWGSVKSLYR